jgi:deoxyadenosine/deoxycytidine kinase
MKSTKYQLLEADFKLALKDIRLRNKRIEELNKEVKLYKQLHKSYLERCTKLVSKNNELIDLAND